MADTDATPDLASMLGSVMAGLAPQAGSGGTTASRVMGALANYNGILRDIGAPPMGINAPQAISAATTLGTTAAANNGLYSLTGTGYIITLPASNTATASNPLCYSFSKNDGTGGVVLMCAGTDTFDNGKTQAAIYNENCTIITFGNGKWYWLERQRGLISISSYASTGNISSTSPLVVSRGMADTDLEEVEICLYNLVPSVSAFIAMQAMKNGAAATFTGSTLSTSSTSATQVNGMNNSSYAILSQPGGVVAQSVALKIRRPWSTIALEQWMDWRGYSANAGYGTFSGSGYAPGAYAISAVNIYPYVASGSPSGSGYYTVRGFRT